MIPTDVSQRARELVDSWFDTTKKAGNDGTTIGFSVREWKALDRAITAALLAQEREVRQMIWKQVRKAQAIWQNNRGEFYRIYHADTFDEWCRTKAAKESNMISTASLPSQWNKNAQVKDDVS